jgi:vacuolar protein sorting-associated protein 52
MWLDRFSGQSTPVDFSPPHSRNYSPVPRRPSQANQKSGLGLAATRSTTSLDLSANTSNVSLPSTSRPINGSSLRNEQRPPPNVPDPLTILRSILRVPEDRFSLEKEIGRANGVGPVPSLGTLEEIDFGGLSLQEFLEQGFADTDIEEPRSQPVTRSTDNRQKYEDFHNSISRCDDVLSSVESYLTSFQAELGQVSTEIEMLQERSMQMNAKLENRRKIEKRLGPAVEEASVSPQTVKAIAEGPVDEQFVQALHEIETRFEPINSKTLETGSVKALEDLIPLLENLKAKAIERIRDFIVAQIKALRSPNINAQVVQQQTLIKNKELYSFLARNHIILAEEIGQAYVNTMKWYYNSNFNRYQQALEKLQLHYFDQHDTLGTDPSTTRRNVLSATKTPQPQHDAFNLGRRADPLKAMNEAAISSYHAEENKSLHYIETPFRNFNLALMDNVCAEYSVVNELFSTSSFQQISRKVIDIFEPAFSIGHGLTKQLIENTTDCLGVLLCVRLNQHFAFEMQRRKVPVADSYINFTNILLWPRFQKLMDMHCESLKRVPTSTNRGASAAFSLIGGTDTSKTSVAPHTITQRFGQFLHGILTLSAEAGDDEPIANSLGRLRSEYEALMMKLAKNAGDASKRSRLLYNNYSLVLTIISDTQGKLAEEQKEHFRIQLKDTKGR